MRDVLTRPLPEPPSVGRTTYKLEEGKEFQLAPELRKACLNSMHCDRTEVGPAYSLLHHDMAPALCYHVQEAIVATTAWFLGKIHTWFTPLALRTRKQAERHLGV